MKRHQTVQQPLSQGQAKDLHCALIGAVPTVMDLEARYLNGRKKKIAEVLKPLFDDARRNVAIQMRWAWFYQQTLDVEFDEHIYEVEFPGVHPDCEHLFVHYSAELSRLYKMLKILQEARQARIELIGISEEALLEIRNLGSIWANGRCTIGYPQAYFLKVLDSAKNWAEPSVNCEFVLSGKLREYNFTLEEMLLYELRYGDGHDNYGPVACANSSPNGDADSIMAFEKRGGVIRIFPVRKDSSMKLVWPSLLLPVAVDVMILCSTTEK